MIRRSPTTGARFKLEAWGAMTRDHEPAERVDTAPQTSRNLRLFCPECGASIAEAPSTRPGMLILTDGTLHDRTSVTPMVDIYCDRALPWVHWVARCAAFRKCLSSAVPQQRLAIS